MARGDDQEPPPGFMNESPDYDLEEMVHITRLENALHQLIEQILSMDPNGMMRIEIVLHRIRTAPPIAPKLSGLH